MYSHIDSWLVVPQRQCRSEARITAKTECHFQFLGYAPYVPFSSCELAATNDSTGLFISTNDSAGLFISEDFRCWYVSQGGTQESGKSKSALSLVTVWSPPEKHAALHF